MLFRLFLLALLAVAAVAADAPRPGAALPVDPAITWGRLPNGLRYALMPNQQPRDKASIRLLVTSGSLLESDPQRGLAHFLEHMAFNGTAHYPPGTLVNQLQALGMSFGADTNAHTSFDETVYKLDLPDTKPATIKTGLTVMADYAGAMLLVPAEVERERGIILAEMRDRETPSFRQWLKLYGEMYRGTAIGARFPIGTKESVTGATAELLKAYFDEWYRPERMAVVIAGAIEPAAVAAQIESAFAGLTARTPVRSEPPRGPLAARESAIFVHREPEADGTMLAIMRLRERPAPVDTVAERRTGLLRDLGEAVLSQRLSKLVAKNPTGPLIAADVGSWDWLGIFHASIDAKVRPGRALAALPEVEQELRRLVEHGPTAAELDTARTQIAAQLDEQVLKAASRTNGSLTDAIYRAIKLDRTVLAPTQERELFAPLLAAATIADVHQAARESWAAGTWFVAVTGIEDLGADGEKAVSAAWESSRMTKVAAPVATAAVTWAYGARPGPIAKAIVTKPALAAVQLAKSGAQAQSTGPVDVVVKRTNFKPNEVLVQFRFAVKVEPRPAGWRELVERGFLAGGLGRHPADELREVLAATPVRIAPPRFDDDTVVIGASCLPQDLEVCLQEMQAFITDPGWRADGEAVAKSAWLDELRAEATSLDAQLARRFQALAVHDAPHRRSATLEEAEGLTFAAVRPWFDGVLRNAPLAITVVGDIDEQATLTLIQPYATVLSRGVLGQQQSPVSPEGQDRQRLTPAATPEDLDLATCQPIPAGVHRFAVPGTVKRALIRVAWPATDYYDIARTRRLGMLAQVLDERMRERIREELGDAYSPFAHRHASEGYAGFGYVMAQVGVAPEKADEALAALLAIANELANKGVSDDVFARVKAPVIKSLATQRQQNQYWLGSVFGRAAWQPFRAEWADTMETDYAAITAADIAKLARQYLINDHALQVIAVCEGVAAPVK